METEDSLDQVAPTATEVAFRILVLKLQFTHVLSAFPHDILGPVLKSVSDADSDVLPVAGETLQQSVWDYATPSEREVFNTSPTDLCDRHRINLSWRVESLACLAWALNLLDQLPPFDTEVDPQQVLPRIPDWMSVEFAEAAQLRPRQEIEDARQIAELWHWRSRTRQLQEEGHQQPPDQPTLEEIVRGVAPKAASAGMIPALIDYDFPAFGKAYRKLTPEEWARSRSIAVERHFALNWLCGYAPGNRWDETPTDT